MLMLISFGLLPVVPKHLFWAMGRFLKKQQNSDGASQLVFFWILRPIIFYVLLHFCFVGGAPTSICHFFCLSVCLSDCHAAYLRNHTSSDINFWYTYVKWWYLQVLFFIFSKFWFFWLLGGKRAKNGPKWKIITSVTHHISGTLHHLILIFGTHM